MRVESGEEIAFDEHQSDQHQPGGRLHQPWRAVVAAVELVLAVVLVVLAVRAWQLGVVPIGIPAPHGATGVVTKSVGSWLVAAVAESTLAGLLLLDALRQLVLSWRVRPEA